MVKILFKAFLFLLFIATALLGEVTFAFDITRFFWNDQVTEVEVHYSIPYNLLSYKNVEGQLEAPFKVDICFENLSTSEFLYDTLERVSVIPSYEEAEKRNLLMLEQFKTYFKPGRYRMTMNMVDINTGKRVTKSEIFNVDSLKGGIELSDIELATLIEGDTTDGQFTKNGLKVIPNPSGIYGTGREMLYFYIEAYNLKDDAVPYEVVYSIINDEGDLVNKIGPKKTDKIGFTNVVIDVGALNLVALKSGFYSLKVEIKDGEDLSSVKRGFQVRREIVGEPEKPSSFTEEEKEHYSKIEYIASDEELSEYKTLSDLGKSEFLKRFWLRRDPNLKTPQNEGLTEFINRLKYVEDKFSTPFKKGYNSDRGRIYIKYGSPDVIETYQFEINYKPYEIWEYYSFGGYQFIFSDRGGDGEYMLIFSSTTKEPSLPNWRKYVPGSLQFMRRE